MSQKVSVGLRSCTLIAKLTENLTERDYSYTVSLLDGKETVNSDQSIQFENCFLNQSMLHKDEDQETRSNSVNASVNGSVTNTNTNTSDKVDFENDKNSKYKKLLKGTITDDIKIDINNDVDEMYVGEHSHVFIHNPNNKDKPNLNQVPAPAA